MDTAILLEAVEQAVAEQKDTFSYRTWQLERVYGGMNGITYRAISSAFLDKPLAVKIRRRDERNRAHREFAALQALQSTTTPVAPQPIRLHTDIPSLPGDVVISSWIDGTVLGNLSVESSTMWEGILSTLATIHSLRQEDAPHVVDAVLPIRSTKDVIVEIERRYARLPDTQLGELTKADIGALFERFKAMDEDYVCPTNELGLIACDTGPSNMIYDDRQVVLVDWENSGWADTAFDLADLFVRPECVVLPEETKMWIINRYADLMNVPKIGERILAYERLMLIFWLILTSNGFLSQPVPRFEGTRKFTLDETLTQQRAYLQRIEAVLV